MRGRRHRPDGEDWAGRCGCGVIDRGHHWREVHYLVRTRCRTTTWRIYHCDRLTHCAAGSFTALDCMNLVEAVHPATSDIAFPLSNAVAVVASKREIMEKSK